MFFQKEIRIKVGVDSIPLSVHVSILKDSLDKEIGRIMVFDDMTPIVNAQRAAAWTEVARRIAHEIKNPLTPIRLSAERLAKKFGSQISDPAFQDSIKMIVAQVDDMKVLVNEFSQFARLPQIKSIPGQINEILYKTAQIYIDTQLSIQFTLDLDDHIPVFKFDPDQFKRVFVNLIDNAIAAVQNETKGQIEIKTKYDKEQRVLKIYISDNGTGISVRDRSRVFEPYFSTKEKGTGLGLPIVKSIIEDHGGTIRVVENNNKGTRMHIEMPILSEEGV
jgi:two-component system nitrogen regulation sensor histidine kinase NtrY